MIKLQKKSQAEIQAKIQLVKENQNATKQVLKTVIEEVTNNFTQIQANKKETDNTLKMFRDALALLDKAMDKPSSNQSPRRKILRPTLPPEEIYMSVEGNSDDDSYGTVQSQTPNNAPKSDDEMTVAAGGN